MKRVTFALTYPRDRAHPMHRRLMDGDGASRADLLTWGPTGSVTTLFWYDGDEEAVGRLVDAVDSVSTASLTAGGDGTYAFVRQTEYELDSAVLGLVARARVAFPPPVTFLDTGTVRFDAVGEAESVSEFHAGLDGTLDVTVERVNEFERARSPTGLTERQRDALEAAVAVGYYAVPRTGSVADVASALDCAPSTAGELLRRAESTVMADCARSE